MVALHGAAVEAAILGGVTKVADGAGVEAADGGVAGGVAVASGGIVHKEFFAVDEAELVAVACGEDFIEGDGEDGALVSIVGHIKSEFRVTNVATDAIKIPSIVSSQVGNAIM